MDTNKDIEESFCAAFSHLFDDGDELLDRAQWVALGFSFLDDKETGSTDAWDSLIMQRYEFKIGHGKATPEIDRRLLEIVFSTARRGYALNLLNALNAHNARIGIG